GSGGGAAGRTGTTGLLDVIRAPGGATGSVTGSDGAAGGHRDAPAGAPGPAPQNGGGGGGGGSVGFIRVVSGDRMLGPTSPAAP
ncbi:MAG: hypothetical protein M3680_08155, partial [Myxococcota bacterium]|nr:hypothetical protein [Myxococcota bacterium]